MWKGCDYAIPHSYGIDMWQRWCYSKGVVKVITKH